MPDSYWFKISPEKYLAIAGRIPDGTQRAEFLAICMHCLATQGGLPDDDEEIAFITAIAVERIAALRPYLNRLSKREDGQIIPSLAEETIAERREYSEKQALSGRKGGKQAHTPESEPQAKLSKPQGSLSKPQAVLSDPQAKQTDKQTDRQIVVVEEFPHETLHEEPTTNATTAICEGIRNVLCQYLNIPQTAGWKTRAHVSEIALELADLGGTADQVLEFIKTRQKPPSSKKYWIDDFLNWRASQPPSLKIVERKFRCETCQDSGSISVFENKKFIRYADCECQKRSVA